MASAWPEGADARLVGDVGGTHARFGWQAGPGAPVADVRVYRCAEHATLQAALERYLADLGRSAPPRAAIGIANPVTGDRVSMTNHPWSFSIEALRRALGFAELVVLNDFEALALALPLLAPDETLQLAGGAAVPGAPLALIGPGTGLGVATLVPAGGGWVALAGEGGHVTLAAVTPREAAVVAALQQRFGHASAERAVSGPGLVWLHDALADLDHAAREPGLTAADVAGRDDARSREAVSLLLAFLGTTAGNLALTTGARGGVYLGGGVLPRLADRLADSPFAARLAAKGRFRGYLEKVPVHLITGDRHPALRGAGQALQSPPARPISAG